jgi:3-oxoacyl-[acyl-carrier-protein] synthase II
MACCLGANAPACWEGLTAGRTGIGPITQFDASALAVRFGGQLPESYYALERQQFSKRLEKQTVSTTRLGCVLAEEAVKDSGLTVEGAGLDAWRCGVLTGSGRSSDSEDADILQRPESQFLVIRQMTNAISAWVSIKNGFRGPTCNIATACASGAHAIAAGLDYIVSGRCDAVLVVGADAMLTRESIFGFSLLHALSERNDSPTTASRPFDRDRDGFVMGNGGGAVMLESEALARRRGARIYAWLRGAGVTSEAYNIVAPDPSGAGMAKCMELACQAAGLPFDAVEYVSAHGTSTHHNDVAETQAIKRVFGEHARSMTVSSQKSMVGHTIGGAGAIEAVATVLSLHHGVLTPTINYTTPDPECDLDYVPNTARPAPRLRVALSNSFGFGGHNCSLLFEKA